jgi:DNA polymerase III epsilon subunit-like protein
MTAKYIAFDCETTGVNNDCHLLTVSFLILTSNLKEIDCLNIALRQPNGYHIYPESLEVNKIDIVKHHQQSIDLIDARRKLLQFLQKYKEQYSLIPIGHNIQFDIKFIKQSGLLTEEEYSKYISYNALDTVTISQFLKLSGKLHEKQSLSLVNLCKSCNLKRNEDLEHSAEYDIKMTVKLLKYFKKLVHDPTEIEEVEEQKNETFFGKKRKLSSI